MSGGAPPGQAWFDIIRRAAPEAFAAAFTPEVALVASVTSRPITGPVAVRLVFDATRAMYDNIAFVRETGAGPRTCLEWRGVFQGAAVEGATILCRDDAGLIERILLFHGPREQVLAISAELEKRLAGRIAPSPFQAA